MGREKHKKHKHHKASKGTTKSSRSVKDGDAVQIEEDEEVDIEDSTMEDDMDVSNNSLNNTKDTTSSQAEEESLDVDIEDDDRQDLKTTEDSQTSFSGNITNNVETPSTSKKSLSKALSDATSPKTLSPLLNSASNQRKTKKRRESGTSSEEERWLTAVEAGKLEEIEDSALKKIKDPKLMTARQRAMYDRNNDTECAPGFAEALVALPTGYKEKEKPQTAEELQKAALKILKRKQQADEKKEKDKKKTMDRLLKKQDNKQKSGSKPKANKEKQPMIRYINTVEGGVIQLPQGVEFPLAAKQTKEPPKRELCCIKGCGQPKVYNCSKTNLPLCSFACYRKNVQSLRQIIC